jgi:hypothetical protein
MPQVRDLRRIALWSLLVAKAVAGIGVGWDIRWHVVIGRDSFWIAPHIMTYAGVAAAALLSFGVLAVETLAARRGRAPRASFRIAGLVGTRGFHLAWWGIAMTIIAAPIDDLWHRLFGIDVTLWSPPHLLGLAGAQINSVGCLLITREIWPAGRTRTIALGLAGLLLFSGFQTGIDPSLRTAFMHGGVRFFTYAMLGGLLLTFALVVTARLATSRAMPVVVTVGGLALQLAVIGIGDAGMAMLRPVPGVADAIAANPTSPIAIAHEIARRSGVTPGRGFTVRLFPILPAIAMALIDPRRRPLATGLGFGGALYVVNGVMFLRSPAFAHVHPDATDALVALVLTILAALAGTIAATAFERRATSDAADLGIPTVAVPLRP